MKTHISYYPLLFPLFSILRGSGENDVSPRSKLLNQLKLTLHI